MTSSQFVVGMLIVAKFSRICRGWLYVLNFIVFALHYIVLYVTRIVLLPNDSFQESEHVLTTVINVMQV